MVYAYWHFVGIWHITLSILNFGPWCPSSTSPWHSGRKKGKGYAVFMKCALAACCMCARKAPKTLTIWAVDRRKVYVMSFCFEMVVYPALYHRQTRDSGSYLRLPQAAGCPCNAVFLKSGRHIWAPLNFLLATTTRLCCFSSHPPPFGVFDVLQSLRLNDTQQKQIIALVQF